MSGDVIELPQGHNQNLSIVTRQSLDSMKSQRELLKEFIFSQLKEANFKDSSAADYGEGDYGIIPGTKKKNLLKPGAEKIMRLFSLGCRVRLADKEINRKDNFAMFTYRCEIYHLQSGHVIAECEGSVNSQEKKYKTRTKYESTKNGRSSSQEETPICDILNTLMKMAQKRAIVGATILATAASDYFTQDMELDESPEATKARAASAATEKKTTEAPKPKAAAQEYENYPPTPPASNPDAPICCGKNMMVSKYTHKDFGKIAPWYCLKCQSRKPRTV